MKIAAMKIPKGYLPHIFGKDHDGITINFGGKNIYYFEADGSVTTKPNEYYLEDIFSDNISLFSCIVGNNGGGKTTLLKLIINSYNCLYIIEDNDGKYQITSDLEKFHRVYYTPYLHHSIFDNVGNNGKELSKIALMKTDNHGDGGQLDDFLDAHHSENSKRWLKFNHFYRRQQTAISLPTFKKLELVLEHFDFNFVNPNQFHDTSYQLRGALSLLISKTETERKRVEIENSSSLEIKHARPDEFSSMIKFEYALYATVIGKIVSILERRGNRYLQEGFIPENYADEINSLNVRSGIEWFLRNSGVYSGSERYSFSKHLNLLDLVDYIKSLVIPQNMTDNWLRIIITEEQALKVIELADSFVNSFINDWFNYDQKPMFAFFPLISVSSGEQQFLNLFSTLFYHAQNIEAGVDIDGHSFDSLKYIDNNILLLLDEADNAFHPQWKKEFVKNLRAILPNIFKDYELQIIITSHDPITLSDIPKNNVVFLEKQATETIVGNSTEKYTFGGNISDLLKDSFFLNDGQIGSFAAGVIDKAINEIKKGDIDQERKSKLARIIKTIDEPIIKFKLAEMLSEASGDNAFEKDLIDNEILRLQQKRNSF